MVHKIYLFEIYFQFFEFLEKFHRDKQKSFYLLCKLMEIFKKNQSKFRKFVNHISINIPREN